jgi:hypothetical protein
METLTTQKETLFQQVADQLQAQGLRISRRDDSRPWGGFFVIDEA